MFHYLTNWYPEKLPVTGDGLDSLMVGVLKAEGLGDDPSHKFAIASAIMHLGPITARKSKRYFQHSLRKSIANQVAFDKIQQLKEEEKAKEAARLAQPEVNLNGVTDGGEPQAATEALV